MMFSVVIIKSNSSSFISFGFSSFGFSSCCLSLGFVSAVAPCSTWDFLLMLKNRFPIWSLFVIQVMMC